MLVCYGCGSHIDPPCIAVLSQGRAAVPCSECNTLNVVPASGLQSTAAARHRQRTPVVRMPWRVVSSTPTAA